MIDRIEISDLRVQGIIGVNDWERETRQEIVINLILFADLRPAGQSDDIGQTVNYRDVSKSVISHVESSKRFTVEALATDLARLCLKDTRVRRVRVRVEKPGAIRFSRSVGVEIEREAGDFA